VTVPVERTAVAVAVVSKVAHKIKALAALFG
jgi:hypothetical protein